jgi:hypothetical protein
VGYVLVVITKIIALLSNTNSSTMNRFITIILVITTIDSHAQVICGTANEGGSITLTAPPGNKFTSIEFASYGTPNGACNSFTIGGCHAANSVSISEAVFLGQNSATISATNGVFGDPCGGTVKRLYIQARYSATLPLTLLSFTAQNTEQGKVKLSWTTEDEINTSQFIVEKSTDGNLFESVDSVPAAGSGGSSYYFTDDILNIVATYYYRLKMVDIDGRYEYSSIARININATHSRLVVFPNPATEFITIVSNKAQDAVIMNTSGQSFKQLRLNKGSQQISIGSLAPGIYCIKNAEGVVKFIKK